jgi:hypothetical protein
MRELGMNGKKQAEVLDSTSGIRDVATYFAVEGMWKVVWSAAGTANEAAREDRVRSWVMGHGFEMMDFTLGSNNCGTWCCY